MSAPSRQAAKPLIQTKLSFIPITSRIAHPPKFTRSAAAAMSCSSSTTPSQPPRRQQQQQQPRQNNNLDRFLTIQDSHRNYATALSEIRSGRKRSHWIWFVFPQIAGLGQFPSQMARHFAIASLDEARAYLAHPVLGQRLREISKAVLDSEVEDVGELMGSMAVDQDKLRSSMTLFKRVVDGMAEAERAQGDEVFEGVLEKYFEGVEDGETVKRLGLH
ncbi:hypothetical protein GE09DRAFT_1152772 [Coniochaeta sp. 2T2.1]|nr:hypothetical protein GE09DRAFT_1152772 [Coniochaeta sp. 2T2.1]